jgi:hypothetical protein
VASVNSKASVVFGSGGGGGGGPTNTDGLPEGSTNLYFSSTRVRATTLTGLSTGSAADVADTDTLLGAVGKLQAKFTGLGSAASQSASAFDAAGTAASAVSSHASATSGVHGISVYGESLVSAADAATARTTLGFGSFGATLAAAPDLTTAQGDLGISTFGATLIAAASSSAALSTLGGTPAFLNVQAAKTGNYALQASDKRSVIPFNSASGATITLNTGLGAGFSVVLAQQGAGAITVSGSATIHGTTSTSSQYDMLSITPIGNDEYVCKVG